MILPSLIFLTLFTYYPGLLSLYLSFFALNTANPEKKFVGLANYQRLWHDEIFWQVMRNNLVFALVTIPVSLALALSIAMFVNRKFRLNSLYRVVFFHPTFIPLIAAAALWLFIFVPQYGLLDQYLTRFFKINAIDWLGDPRYALPSVMMLTIWKNAGYFMIFFLAGLQNISTELFEAAAIEGANSWQRFRYIIWPLLSPTTLFVLITAFIGSFQWVDQVWMLTEGGPDNHTNVLLYYIYQNSFRYYDSGYSAVLTVVLLAILLALSLVSFRVLEERVYYEQ